MLRTAAGFLCIGLLACAPATLDQPDPDPDPDDPDNPDPDPDPDPPEGRESYTDAYWRLTNVSSSAGTISHDPRIAFVGPAPVVAFAEPDSVDFGDQAIHVATTNGLLWTDETIAPGAGEQLAFPSLVSTDGAAHLMYSGPGDDGDRHVFLTGRAGGVWSDPINLTEDGETPEVRQNHRPAVVAAAGGPTALYFSNAAAPGEVASQTEIRVKAAEGEAVVVHTADVGFCFDLRAVADADGAIHAVTDCGGFYYLTNAGGEWSTIEIPLGASGAPTISDIAIGPDGGVHLVWAGRTACPDQGGDCSRIFYSRDLGEPMVAVTTQIGYHPVIAVDRFDRPLIAFHVNMAGSSQVFITHSDDGEIFHAPRALGDGANREWSPSQLVFGPDHRPHLMYERLLSGSDPVDGEIIWATTTDH